MKAGHLAFFYHSNCKNPGIAGIVKVKVVQMVPKFCCGDWTDDKNDNCMKISFCY